MAAIEPNRCYICKKLFCCVDCRTKHTQKKHPDLEPNCSLCHSGILILKSSNIDHIFSHIIFKHLPLQCQSCGDLFKCSEDLHNLGICSCRLLVRRKSVFVGEFSQSVDSGSSSASIQTPSNPENQPKRISFESDYRINFGNFISPPVFSRNTSTPMQIGIIKQCSKISKFPRSPNISCRTPTTFSTLQKNEVKLLQYPQEDSPVTAEKSQSESVYYSFSSSNKSIPSENTPLKCMIGRRSEPDRNSYLGVSCERKLGAMQELDEVVADEMDLTDARGGILVGMNSLKSSEKCLVTPMVDDIRESEKRVRFSDQFDAKGIQDTIDPSSLNATEGEEFFEAYQNVSEVSIGTVEKKKATTIQLLDVNTGNSTGENQIVESENLQEIERVEAGKEVKKIPDEDIEKKSSGSCGSSRVVMMLVVEKTDGGCPTDLAPLINSGLKKLESLATNAIEDSSQSSAKSDDVRKPSIITIDTYSSVSTIERFETPEPSSSHPQTEQRTLQESSNQSGGIFNTVANAFKNALRSLSVGSNKNMNNETGDLEGNFSKIDLAPSASSTLRLRSPSLPSTSRFHDPKYPALMPSKSAPSVSSPPSALLPSISQCPPKKMVPAFGSLMPYSNEKKSTNSVTVSRSAKRGREEDLKMFKKKDGGEMMDDDPEGEEKSPLQKKPRGWYQKIRGRDPIARMKTSSTMAEKGFSFGTQCSQKSSISVNNTVLPLPDHAHQATQTD